MKGTRQHEARLPLIKSFRSLTDTVPKVGNYRKKLMAIIILSTCLIGLELLGQLVMSVGHIDFTTFITVETFMLTNLTAFTTLYEFLENRSNKRNERHSQ